MAYTLEEIKELVETLTPIVKNAIEAGSLSVEDLRVAESMDFVNSLPALEEKGLNVSYVKVRLKESVSYLRGRCRIGRYPGRLRKRGRRRG